MNPECCLISKNKFVAEFVYKVSFLWYNSGMFTGIIEETGIIESVTPRSCGATVRVACKKVLEGVKLGDSIAVNGCCQTVISFDEHSFCTELSPETLAVTTFSGIKPGVPVNLERAVTPSTRLGGHIVQGHVDCCGTFLEKTSLNGFYNLKFDIPQEEIKYVVKKGSITINGVSLTVADVTGKVFSVAVIPNTWENTTLKNLVAGEKVNIETDILGRYVEKFLSTGDNKSRISKDFLEENGFI